MTPGAAPPVLGFVAWSGTGKTTLLEALVPVLKARGLRVGLVKHAHHRFDVDTPGKDSYRLREAGANPVLLASRHRWALMRETGDREEADLEELLRWMGPDAPDLVLVEGFKHERFPKVELHRPALGNPPLYPGDPDVVAVASDAPLEPPPPLPLLDLNDPQALAEWVLTFTARGRERRPA